MPRSTTKNISLKHRVPMRPAKRRATLTRHIVLGTAGDQSSAGAIRVAAALARKRGARVDVVAAVEPFAAPALSAVAILPPPSLDEMRRGVALSRIQRQLGRVHGDTPWPIDAIFGWPGDTLPEEADDRRATLIIMGIGRHRPIDRLLAEETALAVIRRAHVPVLAATRQLHGLPRRAIAAIDFSEPSIRAAALASQLLAPGGSMTLVHIVPPTLEGRSGIAWTTIYEAGAITRLEAIRRDMQRATGRRVRAVLRAGNAVEEVLAFARRERADLIVVGRRSHALLDRMLVGSVTTRILRGASCSVFVAPEKDSSRRPRSSRARGTKRATGHPTRGR
jgi:nucleotide-binding universal stress UspA family protein